MPLDTNKIMPNLCKHGNCFDRAEYEFTDLKVVEEDGKKKSESITLGYACNEHFDEVMELFKRITKDDEKKDY